jgi:hypothetical protein
VGPKTRGPHNAKEALEGCRCKCRSSSNKWQGIIIIETTETWNKEKQKLYSSLKRQAETSG